MKQTSIPAFSWETKKYLQLIQLLLSHNITKHKTEVLPGYPDTLIKPRRVLLVVRAYAQEWNWFSSTLKVYVDGRLSVQGHPSEAPSLLPALYKKDRLPVPLHTHIFNCWDIHTLQNLHICQKMCNSHSLDTPWVNGAIWYTVLDQRFSPSVVPCPAFSVAVYLQSDFNLSSTIYNLLVPKSPQPSEAMCPCSAFSWSLVLLHLLHWVYLV